MRKKVTYYKDWDQMPPVLKSDVVALILDCSVKTIRKYAREATIPANKVGKCWCFDRDVIKMIVKSGTTL